MSMKAVKQTLVQNGVPDKIANNLMLAYKAVTEEIATAKSKSMFYERRKGLEQAFMAMGVSEEALKELKSSLRPERESVSYKARVEELEAELKALQAKKGS